MLSEVPHADQFHPNMGLVALDSDITTTINVWNYYSDFLFSGFSADAIAEVRIFDQNGSLVASIEKMLAPAASLSLDVRTLLTSPLPTSGLTGIAYVRLVPLSIPASLQKKSSVSTEFLVSIRDGNGNGEILHNTLGPIWRPSMARMSSGLMFADKSTWPRYLILANNYFGPIPAALGAGRAQVRITNKSGETRTALSGRVPARGVALFDMAKYFGDLNEFLGSSSGHLELISCNLLRKPWIWFERPTDSTGQRFFSIEHL